MNTKCCISLLLLFLYSNLIKGQELLTNGGFEEYYQCPPTDNAGDPYIDGYLVDWHASKFGRMKHTDCYVGDNDFWWFASTDSMIPYSGKGYASSLSFSSIINFGNKHRAYFMAPLREPMLADSTYRVSYYIHCNRNYALIDHFGATFVRDTSDLFVEQDSNGLAFYTDDYVGYRDTFLGPDDIWHHIEGCYTAKGGERWIALGHFLPFDEVNWHPTYVGQIANSAAAFLLDEVSVTLTTKEKEEDRELFACDGEVVQLPKPNNPNVRILNMDGKPEDSITIDWPDSYTFTYNDACFGELGTITIDSETCYDQIEIEDVICEDEEISFADYMSDENLYVLDMQGNEIASFKSSSSGIDYLTIYHRKYGEVGQATIEAVECDNCEVHMPNVISLRNNLNNFFKVYTACSFENYELAVYDRWGNRFFDSDDPQSIWEPTESMSSGVYVYMLKYKFRHPLDIYEEQLISGTVTLLK